MHILVIAATAKDTSGYGIMTKGFIEALYEMKDNGKLDKITLFTAETAISPEKYDMTITVMNPNSFTEMMGRNPRVFEIYKDTPRNAFNVIFETDRLPKSWDTIFKLDFITDFIVQSDFMKNQVKERTEKKVWTIYPAIESTKIEEVPIEERKKETRFRVLTIGQYTIRKGVLESLIAFSRELGDKEDTEMLLKYHLLSKVEADPIDMFQATVNSNLKHRANAANITIISSELEYSDIIKLYQSASVLLIASRGEGFGIPPVEAMLAGTPVIYTNWSSLPEVCNLPGNYPVDYILDEAYGMVHYGYEKGLKYAVPVISSIMEQLENAYTKWKESKEEYYHSNRAIMTERYGLHVTTRQMEEMVGKG